MKTTKINILLFVAMLTAASLFSGELPSAEDIIAKFVRIAGDEAALQNIKNRLTKSTFEIMNQGISFDMTIRSEMPSSFHMIMSSEQFGTIEKYLNGDLAWEYSAIKGPRLIEGTEKNDLLREARFDKWVNWQEFYDAAETLGEEMVGSDACYKVKLVQKDGQFQTLYFAQESGLLLKLEAKMNTDMGAVSFETMLSDYRQVDGLMLPFKTTVRVLNQTRIVTVNELKHNQDFSLKDIETPEEVKLLLAQSAKK
ncbi:hypothetical protein EH223_16135 [candidate division KSB1 bacterium]|nr:hypothetical protein [candidate division KSB1 bacterium]RQW01056.1 MAG: hypothetical protein EH223_16135 [candidate division KSB1 bacterium]